MVIYDDLVSIKYMMIWYLVSLSRVHIWCMHDMVVFVLCKECVIII